MHSRRREDYSSLSPSSKLRNQHRHDADSFREVVVDRSLVPRVQRRSSSPNNKNDGSRRVLLNGRSGSSERREGYKWQKIRSGSPPFVPDERVRKPHFDEGFVHRKHEHTDDAAYGNGKSSRVKHVYGYGHHPSSSRMMKDENYSENRILDMDEGVILEQKLMPVEDGIVRGSNRVTLDYIPPSNYEKTGSKHLQFSSRHMDTVRYDNEKVRHREPVSPDSRPVKEFHKEQMFRSRDDSYGMKPTSQFKDFAGSSSSGISRREFLGSYREGMPVSITDEYPRNGMEVTEPMDFNTFGQRVFVDTRNNETGKRVIASYSHGAYSPNRSDHDDYVYSKSRGFVVSNNDYPPEEFRRMMPQTSRFDHEQDVVYYEHRELPKMRAPLEKVDHTEDYYSNMRNSSTWEENIHDQMSMENHESSRIIYAQKHDGEYFGSEYTRLEFGRRNSREDGTSNLNTIKDQKISHLKQDYGFGRDAGPQFQKQRLQDPGMAVYDLDMPEIPSKRHRIEDEFAVYEQSNKVVRRMHGMEENMNRRDSRTVKNYPAQEYEDEYGSGEEWIDEDTSDLRPSRNERFDHTMYRKVKRTYDCHGHHRIMASEDWTSQQSLGHSHKNQDRYYKPGVKYVKSHPRSGPINWYNSNQGDKRSGIYRKSQNWKRNDEYGEEEEDGGGPLEDWTNATNSDPSEDSEEFKQLVHEFFLNYSKILNLNSAVCRRYKEQGKAGSLFCIVCGRSTSKEFMDTQRLTNHAYMSHKVGLKAKHMGLHKALCVLMGWNTYVPCDTTTWIPDVLSDSEAWAQKEDLMLWPPLIIIHNISMSNNNPEQQQVIPIEGVQAFLRAKGFVGGKIKVCLGKPADQSVILVKFLGTFTGLGQAEKLNKYFLENKRGRQEFDQKTLTNNIIISKTDMEGDKIEEILLYGYTGVADDLDKIDFNTKKWITLKSKKDIRDLEDAPLKTDDR